MEDKEKVKQSFINAIILGDKLSFEGKFRLADKQTEIINSICEKLKTGQVDISILLDLSNHENMLVRHLTTLTMLRLNFMTEKALEGLKSVANANVLIYSLVAQIQIKDWEKYGTVDPNKKDKEKHEKVSMPKKKMRSNSNPSFEFALAKYEELNNEQRIAYLTYWYDSEVNNGGHFQYFTNMGTEHLQETIDALKIIGANKQAGILTKAKEIYLSKKRVKPNNLNEYLKEDKQEEFLQLDDAFYSTKPEVMDLVDDYLEKYNL